ncbi:transcriptional regulator [halophilic archaeon]|nr:transcriptional regulator [halophilic archaeon]
MERHKMTGTQDNLIINCSPSQKLVYLVISQEGALTTSEITHRTLLPKETVQYAVTELCEEGLIEQTYDFSDIRNRKYRLPDEERV